MKANGFIFLLLASVMCLPGYAKKLAISHVEHPTVEKVYLPLIQAMYKAANIEIELYYVNNSPRSIKGLNDGLFDADVGKILLSVENYENIIHVPTPISKVSLFLACAKDVKCNKSVLLNEQLIIASPYPKSIIENITPIEAVITLISSKAKTTQMLELGRVEYILFGDDTQTKMFGLQRNFQIIEIERAYIYHVLHKKHAGLIPLLDKALKQVIAKQEASLLPMKITEN